MDGKIKTEAVLLGINSETWEALRAIGVHPKQARDLAGEADHTSFTLAARIGITVFELTTVRSCPLSLYIKLRQYVAPDRAEAIWRDTFNSYNYLNLLQSGWSDTELERAIEANVFELYHDTKDAFPEVTFTQLLEYRSLAKDSSSYSYSAALSAGITHAEIISVIGQVDEKSPQWYPSTWLDSYRVLRQAGLTHDEFVSLGELAWGYVGLRVHHDHEQLTDVGHADALEALRSGVDPRRYIDGKRTLEPAVFNTAVAARVDPITFASLRKANVRVSDNEIVAFLRYSSTAYETRDINDRLRSFLDVVDSGISSDDIIAASQVQISAGDLRHLRNHPYDCSQDQVLEIAAAGVRSYQYQQLRDAGVSHDDILDGAASLAKLSEV